MWQRYDWSFAYSGLINGDCALVYDQYVTVADSMEMDEQFTKEHLGVFPFPYIEGAREIRLLLQEHQMVMQ